ncbi:MAG: hypothetical protein D6775_01550 [Caldilineae bacterium]|nr:MAG: hypothetical protein D6775_01550 [Caldilineae bacterium]
MTLSIKYLTAPATVAAAIALVKQAQPEERLVLVLPEQAEDFAHEVRLDVLRRQADAMRVQVGLVTQDEDIVYFARQARIPTFDTLERARNGWRYPRPAPPLPPPGTYRPLLIQPPSQAGLGLAAPAIVKRDADQALLLGETRRRIRPWWLTVLGYLVVAVLILAMLGAVVLYILPEATVTLVPERTRFVSSLEITAQVGLDEPEYINALVPARIVQARVEGFDTVNTTGVEEAPVGKATGLVTFVNQTSREIVVPPNTVVRTSTGNNVRFRVREPITVTAGIGAQATGLVEAIEPGRAGNVPAFTINEIEGPLNLSLRVSNQVPTAGGTVESVAVVTQADKERLAGKLQEELQRQAYARLAASLRQGEFIPPETVKTFTLAETYDRFAGEQADVLGMQLQLLARGLAIDLAGAQNLVERSLRESIPADHFLLEETLQIGQPGFVRFDEESATFTLTASAEALIPVKSGEVRTLLAGVPLDEAAPLLQKTLALAETPQITVQPEWLRRLPRIPTRINVRVLQGSAPDR